MEALSDLTKGLKILDPFLQQHGFVFDNFDNEENFVGMYTIATYKNDRKRFIVNYLPTIDRVDYQFDNIKAYHDFYLEQLGFGERKNFKGFNPENKHSAFNQILQDFEYLIDDFFEGQCTKLQELSKLNEKILKEYNKNAHEEFSAQFDLIRIETARDAFGKKDFKKSLGIYLKVENTNLLNNLDRKLIENCKLQVLKK